MKTKKILKILNEIRDSLPPKKGGIFHESFVSITFYTDGSGHITMNNGEIPGFSFGENFREFKENHKRWKKLQ